MVYIDTNSVSFIGQIEYHIVVFLVS